MNNENENHTLSAPARVKLVGIGGMGVNTLDTLQDSSADYADCIAIDTDIRVLQESTVPLQVQIGASITRGHSTGGDPDLGRRSANGDFAKLRELFTNADLVILLVGLGGGTGSGAAPVIAQTARDEGALVISVGAMPFLFEGDERRQQAEEAVTRLKESSQAVIAMPNQHLIDETQADVPITESFQRAAEKLGSGFRVIWTLLGQRNLVNVDFISLKNMLETAGGGCSFIYVEAGGPSKAKLALSRVMKHPAVSTAQVLDQTSGLLIGVLGGEDLTLLEVQEVIQGITGAVHANARRFIGAGIDPRLRNRLAVLLLVGEKGGEQPPEATPVAREAATKPMQQPAPSTSNRKQQSSEQAELELPSAPSKGRFKGVEPTLYQGEDLDLPTFIRRGMKLSR